MYGIIALFMPFMMNAVAISCQYIQIRIMNFDEDVRGLSEVEAWNKFRLILKDHQLILRLFLYIYLPKNVFKTLICPIRI